MSTRTAASLLWGAVVGLAIGHWLLGFGIWSALGVVAMWSIVFTVSVLYDEWRYPATSITYRGPR